MRNDVEVRLGPGDRERLEAVVADRNSAQALRWTGAAMLGAAKGFRRLNARKQTADPPGGTNRASSQERHQHHLEQETRTA